MMARSLTWLQPRSRAPLAGLPSPTSGDWRLAPYKWHLTVHRCVHLTLKLNRLSAVEYTNTISTNKNVDTVRKIRSLLAEAGMTEVELALVSNLQLESAEEAQKLIPSLNDDRFSTDELNRLLLELQNYSEFD